MTDKITSKWMTDSYITHQEFELVTNEVKNAINWKNALDWRKFRGVI